MTFQPPPVQRSPHIVQRTLKLLGALALLSLAVYIILRAGGATRMNFDRTVFTIVNTVTLTGFQLPVNPADLSWHAQLAIFALLCGSILTWLIVGGWALVRVLRMSISDDEVVYGSVVVFGMSVIIGATVLIDRTKPIGPAVFEATSAFGNFGLTLQRATPVTDWRLHLVNFPLALIGALGIPVVLDLARCAAHFRRPHAHASAALGTWALVYLIGMAMILLLEMSHGLDGRSAAIVASAGAIDSRTLGATSLSINSLARGSQWVILLLMMIGACPAGAGGGIKSTTLLVLFRDALGLIRGNPVGRALGFACVAVAGWMTLVFATMLFLLDAEPQLSFERLIFISASAASNVGLSHEPLSLGAGSLHVLSLTMLLGRLLPLVLLCWAAKRQPELDIAIG